MRITSLITVEKTEKKIKHERKGKSLNLVLGSASDVTSLARLQPETHQCEGGGFSQSLSVINHLRQSASFHCFLPWRLRRSEGEGLSLSGLYNDGLSLKWADPSASFRKRGCFQQLRCLAERWLKGNWRLRLGGRRLGDEHSADGGHGWDHEDAASRSDCGSEHCVRWAHSSLCYNCSFKNNFWLFLKKHDNSSWTEDTEFNDLEKNIDLLR